MNETDIHVDGHWGDGAAAIASSEAEDPANEEEPVANDLLDALLLVSPGLPPLEDSSLGCVIEALENAQTVGDLLELFEDFARGDGVHAEL